jgi:hypothetical protein
MLTAISAAKFIALVAIGEKSVGTIIVFMMMIISEINVAQEPRHGNDLHQ